MNLPSVNNDDLISYNSNSPPLYLQRFPINNVHQPLKGVELERRGSQDSGVDLTEDYSNLVDALHYKPQMELSKNNSIRHINNTRESALPEENIFTEIKLDSSFEEGNGECLFENTEASYPFANASMWENFEDVDLDLIYFSEDMILEVYLEESEVPKKTVSIFGALNKFLYSVMRIIVEPYRMPLYIYMVFISIIGGVLNFLKSVLYTQPRAVYLSLQPTA